MTTQKTQLQKFEEKALKQFTKDITDLFFQYVESDKKLMYDYLRVIGRTSSLDETNMALGAAVKEWFGLENGVENKEPTSYLIESYTEHYRKGHK